ncbi:glycoside hydrolase family 113 [Thalassobellus suaedae]|uniref:Glycoside hydrolase n=1 Tax=Thalassobellus suaedae TaxID=3074124 RepID=A0ABY9Y6H4_9FLAO|nr:glycoside hydrolase [Flavobacteriaceae bacterium HL-DH10]
MRIFLVFASCLLLASCSMTSIKPLKINGVSFVASRDSINNSHVNPIINIHANYAALMPFGFIKDLEHPEVRYNSNRQWFGETRVGVKQYVDVLKNKGIKVMVKPQIWVSRGQFTGFIKMNNDEEWLQLETTYSKFILEYARIAEDVHADIFCIGTELETFIDYRPDYWKQLIKEIRALYSGKLTYAANWNEYDRTPFWDQLDYIGIDAYFPVSDEKTPTVEVCKAGLIPYKEAVAKCSKTLKKPILFTEFGYRSVDFSGKEPWKSDRSMTDVNLEAQKNTTQALFETFWNENWFAGGFLWKWHHNNEKAGGENNSRFTPQNKPAEALIKDMYANY